MTVDILLRLKAGGITTPYRFAWLGVSALALALGLFGFGFTDSQYQASPPLESVCGRSLRNLQGVPHLSPQYSSLHPMRSPCVGCATGAVVSGRHSGSPDSELLALVTRARCLLFDSHMGHILFPAWADTHTRTATCRALGYTRVRADMPTLAYTPLSIRNVRKPQYNGAYPRREQAWYCACTIYNMWSMRNTNIIKL